MQTILQVIGLGAPLAAGAYLATFKQDQLGKRPPKGLLPVLASLTAYAMLVKMPLKRKIALYLALLLIIGPLPVALYRGWKDEDADDEDTRPYS